MPGTPPGMCEPGGPAALTAVATPPWCGEGAVLDMDGGARPGRCVGVCVACGLAQAGFGTDMVGGWWCLQVVVVVVVPTQR